MEGYMKNSRGYLVPMDQVKDLDLLRNDLVNSIAKSFIEQRVALRLLKQIVLDEIAAFVDMSAEKYGAKTGGKKGNISMMSFDGSLKVSVQIAEYIVFDERLQVAKSLIDGCITRWSDGADDRLRSLIDDAFQVDKKGNVSTTRILGLRRIDIEDEEWQSAMQAIADSMTTSGSKTYIRAYERVGQEDKWRVISLDFAALEVA